MQKLFIKPKSTAVGATPSYNAQNTGGFPTMQALPILPGVPSVDTYGAPQYQRPSMPPNYPPQTTYMQDVPMPFPPDPMTDEEIAGYYAKPQRNATHAFLTKAKACINCTYFMAYMRGSDGEHLNLCKYRGISPWNKNFTCAGSYCALYCEKGKETSNLQATSSKQLKKRTRRTRAEIEAAKSKYEKEQHMAQPRPDDPLDKAIEANGGHLAFPETSALFEPEPPHIVKMVENVESQRKTQDIDSKITFGGNR